MFLSRVFETVTLLQIHPVVESFDSCWGERNVFLLTQHCPLVGPKA